jgi:phosphoribosylformylglycinamidine synthase
MSAYEMMLSESQERMLMVLRPEKIDLAQRIFKKWELDCTVIGTITDTQRLVITHRGVVEVDLPLSCLADTAPEYNRPWVATPVRPVFFSENETLSHDTVASMTNALLNHPNIQSKAWIWEQYDSTVMGDTLATPGGDAGIVRIHGTQKALAATTDCTPRYCYADPVLGGTLAVVQAYRNLSAVGAQPLAITNNLNFGNPQKPDIMGQLVGCVQGMGQACRALDFPVISGNVSLYNETDGRAILPTPVIGGVGVLTDYRLRIASFVQDAGLSLVLLGTQGAGWLGCTLWQQVCTTDTTVYAPPPVNLAAEKHLSQAIKTLAQNNLIRACHDVGEGGLLIALTEMLGNHPALGMDLTIPTTAGILFGEDMGRYIVATHDETALHQALGDVPHIILGDVTQGPAWTLNGTALFPDGPQRKPLTF